MFRFVVISVPRSYGRRDQTVQCVDGQLKELLKSFQPRIGYNMSEFVALAAVAKL